MIALLPNFSWVGDVGQMNDEGNNFLLLIVLQLIMIWGGLGLVGYLFQ
jgi:hypothetical protein